MIPIRVILLKLVVTLTSKGLLIQLITSDYGAQNTLSNPWLFGLFTFFLFDKGYILMIII